MSFQDPLEQLWDQLLSREPVQVWQAFQGLPEKEQGLVLSHLHRMAEEAGWHPEQRRSALSALEALAQHSVSNDSDKDPDDAAGTG